MANQYWGIVRQRISSLGNTIVSTTTPVLVSYAVEQIVEKTCRIIESKIKQMYINAFVYSGWSDTIKVQYLNCRKTKEYCNEKVRSKFQGRGIKALRRHWNQEGLRTA